MEFIVLSSPRPANSLYALVLRPVSAHRDYNNSGQLITYHHKLEAPVTSLMTRTTVTNSLLLCTVACHDHITNTRNPI